jgi:putative nucleotidyltransferase with HDIG domain
VKKLFGFKYLKSILYFVASALVISYFLPIEKGFDFDYNVGMIWKHKDLKAPFDFPIYKTQEKIDEEIRQISAEAKTVLRIDDEIAIATKLKLRNELDLSGSLQVDDKELLFSEISQCLDSIYSRGVISASLQSALQNQGGAIILLGNNNLAMESEYEKLIPEDKALDNFHQILRKNVSPKHADFIKQIALSIKSNLVLDKEKSELILSEQLSNVALTEGLVNHNDLIISKGEVVDESKYQILESLRREFGLRNINTRDTAVVKLSKITLDLIILAFLFLFLLYFRPGILLHTHQLAAILITIVLTVVSASLVYGYDSLNIYLVPFCILTILMRSFFDTRLALFAHLTTILITGIFAPNGYEFLLLQFAGGMTTIFSFVSLRRRSQLLISTALIFLIYTAIYTVLWSLRNGGIFTIHTEQYKWFAISAGFTLLAYPVIFIYEKLFGLTSDVTLLELSDMNNKLLRLLSEKAPGTFQHSLQVANLAEAAAENTGANALLVRTGALYHDIGKINAPQYFIENLVEGINPHSSLSFEESAEKIIAHVHDGVVLAQKYRLPQSVIQFIQTHHGTTKVQYFYRNYLKQFPDIEASDKKFSYPGPIPATKEEAILMMADSVEAASRSMKTPDDESINHLVESIVGYQIAENQFADSNLTLKDITKIKEVFKAKLKNIYHIRIAYPGVN